MSARYDCADPVQRERGLRAAAAAVGRGSLVVLPTDTVYGVGADAFRPSAVSALLDAKGRGRAMPVPVLVASAEMADALVDGMSVEGRALVDAFWPGGLTLVVRHTPHLAWDLGDTRGTVAVRMPRHDTALELIEATGPMAVSSANRSGLPPAATVDDALSQLAELVAVYLDEGPCEAAVPSTIVDLTVSPPRVLRAGALPVEHARAVVPELAGPE